MLHYFSRCARRPAIRQLISYLASVTITFYKLRMRRRGKNNDRKQFYLFRSDLDIHAPIHLIAVLESSGCRQMNFKKIHSPLLKRQVHQTQLCVLLFAGRFHGNKCWRCELPHSHAALFEVRLKDYVDGGSCRETRARSCRAIPNLPVNCSWLDIINNNFIFCTFIWLHQMQRTT